MYNVGFGDAFLLSFDYAHGEHRHVLVDFGTMEAPPGRKGVLMEVARNIAEATAGKLHVVVATHRHKDHIAGFDPQASGKGPGAVIAALKPDVVLLPWTEDPAAAEDAQAPTTTSSPEEEGRKRVARFLRSLAAMEQVASAAAQSRAEVRSGVPRSLAERIAFIGEDNVSNVGAVRNLLSMAPQHRFLHFGVDPKIDEMLPGVTVHVLGPPTLKDSPAIAKMRYRDNSEFWMLAAAAAAHRSEDAQAAPIFEAKYRAKVAEADEETRWLTERLNSMAAEQQLGLVTVLDDVMNNTSLILLLDVGGHKLLFPGDAQIENWEYALAQPGVQATLADVELLKVGHHGSRNATPKTLWNGFTRKRSCGCGELFLTSLLSTRAGKHGCASKNTEVPRRTLLQALREESQLHSTETEGASGASPLFIDVNLTF